MKKLFLAFVIFVPTLFAQNNLWILSAPAYKEFTKIDRAGTTVIPNGRFITPLGNQITTAPHPYGLVLSPDGNTAVTANSGTGPLSITIIKNILSGNPQVMQVPPGASTDKGVLESVFMGLAISPDSKIVYVSGGQTNKIYLFNLSNGSKIDSIDCALVDKQNDYSTGYIGDMVLSKDGKKLFAVDQINFRMIVIDTKNRKLIQNVPVGRYPFGISLSPDEKNIFVANVGMYEYKKIKILNEKKKGMNFPPFAYLSKESEKGIKDDEFEVPGLGNPYDAKAFSVFVIENKAKAKVIAKIKTGIQIGEKIEDIPAIGGASPNSIAATNKLAFVSNGTNDNISVIDIRKKKVVKTIKLVLDERLKHFRGVIPYGLTLSADHKRLYVAESGINAIAVIDVAKLEVLGHIPTGWFPAKLKLSNDGKKIIVANAKGFGSGPNGGTTFKRGPEGSYIGSLMKGTVGVFDIPSDEELKALTQKVIENNFRIEQSTSPRFAERKDNPIPLYPKEKIGPIKHVVFISKENRTYDEVFGQIKNGEGDSTIARYGYDVSFTNRNKTASVNNATIMPNHLALAKRFAISDNFYVDADVSADGHRWLSNTYPNEWVETTVPASYGDNREYKKNSKSPGILSFTSSAGAIYPEDYNEAGSMWDHLDRNKKSFFNFGFALMFEPADYDVKYKQGGVRHIANFPLPAPLFANSSKIYPTYNTSIPDQFRIDMFQKEFKEKWLDEKKEIPSMLTVIIPNDHGAGEKPDKGYPFRESYMADNDLAVGRIVEFLSHTPYWKNMMIVITEDDAQNGVDHVDAHRSILMVISPYVKKNYVSHVHYSFGSLFKTFWNVLGIPYLNQYDAGANDLADFFTNKPDFTPYNALHSDVRFFDPQKALDPLDEKFDWKSLKDSPEIDNVQDMMREAKETDKDRLENREKK
ncbi:MAG: 40-residue YVTN family beta-propeller repeat protein [Stygiobacter sp.]|nr:MAG: 40-residue YVTN family beta-propeller repeat protein [Stygiobacter sp.]KAF0217704.1 MAG: 40-residue YVTN family beta-propeller repeat [Ignavibacteria bacterium]